jgi:16S rRNA (guanine527-N7)-methyltransferase
VNLVASPLPDVIWERHVVHCLTLCRHGFPAGATILDWGTGGGLPAIPLAVCNPTVRVIGLDAVGKKVAIGRMMARRLQLANLEMVHSRAEEYDGEWDYSVSRATAPLSRLLSWHRRSTGRRAVRPGSGQDLWSGKLLALKGGDLGEEIADLKKAAGGVRVELHDLGFLTGISYLQKKYIVEVGNADVNVTVERAG